MSKEELRNLIERYILQQFDSLAGLRRLFNQSTIDDLADPIMPDEYKVLFLKSLYLYRMDILNHEYKAKMSSEEKEFWKKLGYYEEKE